jgi:hypothetical protein
VVVLVSGVLEHETNVRPATATTPLNNIAFFIRESFVSQPIRHKLRPQMY